MNFCSNCGSSKIAFKVPLGDNRLRYCCESCATIHYQNPNIIVGAIPVWEGKILLARRNISPRKGFWNLPCGFLELNETVEDGAKREVLEETGSQILLKNLQTVYNLPDANQVYMIFNASMQSDYFKPTTESAEVELFAIDEIPWSKIAFSSNTFALKQFIIDLQSGSENVHFGTFRKSKTDKY